MLTAGDVIRVGFSASLDYSEAEFGTQIGRIDGRVAAEKFQTYI